MRESLFWEIVEFSATAGRSRQAASLYRILVGIPAREIASFARLQRRKMAQLCTSDILAAHFILCSYTSDDTFEDFTGWIVAQGKKTFNAVRKDPSFLAQILARKEIHQIEWDAFTLLAGKAYEERTGKDDLRLGVLPDIPIRWPESRKEFESRYPVLYRKFWNQKRIRQIHSH